MYKLQDVNLMPTIGNEQIGEMYFRSNKSPIIDVSNDNVLKIRKGTFLETFTYFGALSLEKWKKYTYAERFCIILDVEGNFDLTLFGHFHENNIIKKEWLGKYQYKCSERMKIKVDYPEYCQSQVVAFSIEAHSNIKLYDIYYATELERDSYNNPYISLVTTTYKKEDYIKRNIKVLKKELFTDDEFVGKFIWHIVDNGGTLECGEFDNISIVHNKNVGGAGGFARGMIDSLCQIKNPTHILLMDDDVKVSPESFKRLYRLLNILRSEYTDYFVGGAMLNMDSPNIQHENTAYLSTDGRVYSVNTGMDMNLWDSIIRNESIDIPNVQKHAAWWFCCMPTSVARLDNLPLPIFVRGDDLEYSIRNHARIITLNGIAIWHQSFISKSNPIMDYYQSRRNELVLQALHPELKNVDTFGFIEEIFWQEIYKFNYDGANLLLDAIEDFLKGPDWLFSTDLFEVMRAKKNEAYVFQPITDKIRKVLELNLLHQEKSISPFSKFIYDYTYNGQARIPSFLVKWKIGLIPYGGYFPQKQYLTSVNYVVDSSNDKYMQYIKNRGEFKKLKKRYIQLKNRFSTEYTEVCTRYRNFFELVTSKSFWDEYLK